MSYSELKPRPWFQVKKTTFTLSVSGMFSNVVPVFYEQVKWDTAVLWLISAWVVSGLSGSWEGRRPYHQYHLAISHRYTALVDHVFANYLTIVSLPENAI